MIFEIIKKKKEELRLPGIGEFWKHRNRSSIYIRVHDYDGAQALKNAYLDNNVFYSVALQGGGIQWTCRDETDDIVILRPLNNRLTLEEV